MHSLQVRAAIIALRRGVVSLTLVWARFSFGGGLQRLLGMCRRLLPIANPLVAAGALQRLLTKAAALDVDAPAPLPRAAAATTTTTRMGRFCRRCRRCCCRRCFGGFRGVLGGNGCDRNHLIRPGPARPSMVRPLVGGLRAGETAFEAAWVCLRPAVLQRLPMRAMR